MTDISKTVEPKSDQANADDFLAGSKTIEIESVKVVAGDQPVHIGFKGDNKKPYKPCKSMRRVLIMAWGSNGEDYIGQQMTLFCDPDVKWAGSPVGGIRISHMSGLPNNEKLRLMLTETRGKRGAYVVEPLIVAPKETLSEDEYGRFCASLELSETMPELSEIAADIKAGNFDKEGSAKLREKYQEAVKRVRESK